MNITKYHGKYFAYELTRQRRGGDVDRISQSLFDAAVDLNPHQIDAALFALQNPLVKGVLLADEVGLGKTIEAALVLCQFWAERRRRLLIICPASLRKQWANELSEKFQLPAQVLDARTVSDLRKQGIYNPFAQNAINIISFNFAAAMEQQLMSAPWDLVVIDEAHKLRNAHRESNRTGQAIKRAFASSRKVLLTATPLQNSLMELYGLSTVIDEQLFGDAVSFRSMYMRNGTDIPGLKARLSEFTRRTLRRDVLEYVRYTERKAVTIPFSPAASEQRLYELVSAYLQREGSYGVPHRQRHLVALVVRKLLASSTSAVIRTLETLLERLRKLDKEKKEDANWLQNLIEADDLDEELLEIEEVSEEVGDMSASYLVTSPPAIDRTRLSGEIAELEQYLELARAIPEDAKSHGLLQALDIGFARMQEMGAPRKVVIFTESRRTQDYLAAFLDSHGYRGNVVTFSGSNGGPAATVIYQRWLKYNLGGDQVTGSPAIDRRTALIHHFRDEAQILIATEAAAEGVNLQFCNLVVNYDLPWNPQRIEQRIGRCHRYGQKFDVVVVNFLNLRNAADKRVLELLSDKFHLFDGLFGASDEILGRIESGVDFERRISEIYDTCRTADQIELAFAALQKELEDAIDERMRETQSKLLDHFDEGIHELLRIQRDKAEAQLDRIGRLFWRLTRLQLREHAEFEDNLLGFVLRESPCENAPTGRYQLIRKGQLVPEHTYTYRLTHPLGEHVLDTGRRLSTPVACLQFDLSGHEARIVVLEQLSARQGWLELNLLQLDSFQHEEHLVFSALTDAGDTLDHEACERLFSLCAKVGDCDFDPPSALAQLAHRQIDAALSRALEENNVYFQRERDKLEAWADDQIHSAEKQLQDTKDRIKDAKRRARVAETPQEQKIAQEELKELETRQRRQRQKIFEVEDEIEAQRDRFIEALERRMHQKSTTHHLFRIRWHLV
jgi:ERCC4-related helicase